MSNNQEHVIEKVGVFTPKPIDIEILNSGSIGFIITGINFNHFSRKELSGKVIAFNSLSKKEKRNLLKRI